MIRKTLRLPCSGGAIPTISLHLREKWHIRLSPRHRGGEASRVGRYRTKASQLVPVSSYMGCVVSALDSWRYAGSAP